MRRPKEIVLHDPRKYDLAAPGIAFVAQSLTGRPIPPESTAAMQIFARAALETNLARKLIVNPDKQSEIYQRINFLANVHNFVDGSSETMPDGTPAFQSSLQGLNAVLSQIPLEKKEDFLKRGRRIFSFFEGIREIYNVDEVSRLKRQQGIDVIEMFLDLLPDDYQTHPYYPRLESWMTGFFPLATSIDFAVDLPKDFKRGETVINPNGANRTRILVNSLPDLVQGLKETNSRVFLWGSAMFLRLSYAMVVKGK